MADALSGDLFAGRVAYVNGAFAPLADASISILDRGFLFGDGVYEVCSVLDGKLVDNASHLARLRRSLAALSLPSPASDDEIVAIQRELVARNGLLEGMVYLQATRGVAERSFDWPANPTPSLVMFTQAKAVRDNPQAEIGLSVAIVPDQRWRRRDIKTVNLLPASWAKAEAAALGADDAWMEQDGRITEGSSNNAFILLAGENGAPARIVTRQLGTEILPGVTRRAVLALASESGFEIEERGFTATEAKSAAEAFVTSASAFVLPVVRIDETTIGDGRPGSVARRLRHLYIQYAEREST